jgi:hypothetical protein
MAFSNWASRASMVTRSLVSSDAIEKNLYLMEAANEVVIFIRGGMSNILDSMQGFKTYLARSKIPERHLANLRGRIP